MTPYRDAPSDLAICPRCTEPSLSLHARRGARVLACKRCGGLFAEKDTVLRMLEGDTEALVELAEDATRAPPNPKLVPIDLECPRCGIQMTKVHVWGAQVMIDVCPGHGIWFDRWEAQLVSHVAADPGTQAALRAALLSPPFSP